MVCWTGHSWITVLVPSSTLLLQEALMCRVSPTTRWDTILNETITRTQQYMNLSSSTTVLFESGSVLRVRNPRTSTAVPSFSVCAFSFTVGLACIFRTYV
jgi:hypothetical protein